MDRYAFVVRRELDGHHVTSVGFLGASSRDEASGTAMRQSRASLIDEDSQAVDWPIGLVLVWRDREGEVV